VALELVSSLLARQKQPEIRGVEPRVERGSTDCSENSWCSFSRKFAVCSPFRRRNNLQTEAKPYSILQCRRIGKSKKMNESATILNSQQQHRSPLLTGGL
jgi:hypothetical protein